MTLNTEKYSDQITVLIWSLAKQQCIAIIPIYINTQLLWFGSNLNQTFSLSKLEKFILICESNWPVLVV